jgi:protein-tyrosine phosphatase
MREIIPDILWIGNAGDTDNLRELHDRNIAAVVDLAYEEPPKQLTRDLISVRIPLVDGDGNDSAQVRLAISIVRKLLDAGTPTLVVCGAGMSRSPAIAAAAIAENHAESPVEALKRVTDNQPHDVSPGLWAAILDCCGSNS